MTYTDEELLDALREYADEHGEPPTSTEANDTEGMASAVTYHHRFGSWNRALEMAGFEPHKPTLSDEELLDRLREYADKHGQPPTGAEANAHDTLPYQATYTSRFGSWNAAVEAAGFTPRRSSRTCSGNTRHDTLSFLTDLRAFAVETDEQPTTMDLRDRADMASPGTYRNRFGSWNRALEMAGSEPHKPTLSDEDLLDMFREFADEHGRPPTQADAGTEQGLPSKSAFRNHFGSWTAALDATGLASGRTQKKLHSDDEKSSQHHANP